MKQKVADFLVLDQQFQILKIIELDDSSHDSKKEKDAIRDRNAEEAGLETIRWHVSNLPDRTQIRWKVLGIKAEPDGQEVSRLATH